MFAFGMPGGWEWIALLAIVLLLFGHRIPGMARSLGSGITEFKRGLKDGSGDSGGGRGTGAGGGKLPPEPGDQGAHKP